MARIKREKESVRERERVDKERVVKMSFEFLKTQIYSMFGKF